MEFRNIEEIKTEGSFIKAICFKPKKAPIVCAIVGVLLIALRNIYTIILGVFFLVMAFSSQLSSQQWNLIPGANQGAVLSTV